MLFRWLQTLLSCRASKNCKSCHLIIGQVHLKMDRQWPNSWLKSKLIWGLSWERALKKYKNRQLEDFHMAGIELKARKTKLNGSRKSWEIIHRGSPTHPASPGWTSRAWWRMMTSLSSLTWRLKTKSIFAGSSMKSSTRITKAARLPSSPWRDLPPPCQEMTPRTSLLKLWSSES